jgi:hypothetical protein
MIGEWIAVFLSLTAASWAQVPRKTTSSDASPIFGSIVAQHCASWDPDRVFFEILNEPEMRDAYRRYGVEAKLAAAIRRGAPANTIIAAARTGTTMTTWFFSSPCPMPMSSTSSISTSRTSLPIRVQRGEPIAGTG